MDTMLGIGRRVGSVTYREIVGDTTQWKKEHIDEIMAMCHPNKRQIVKDLARFYRVHRVEVLDNLVLWAGRFREEEPELFRKYGWDFSGVREFDEPREYPRLQRSKRPVLAPRRPGEERQTSRRNPNPYANKPRLLPHRPGVRWRSPPNDLMPRQGGRDYLSRIVT